MSGHARLWTTLFVRLRMFVVVLAAIGLVASPAAACGMMTMEKPLVAAPADLECHGAPSEVEAPTVDQQSAAECCTATCVADLSTDVAALPDVHPLQLRISIPDRSDHPWLLPSDDRPPRALT